MVRILWKLLNFYPKLEIVIFVRSDVGVRKFEGLTYDDAKGIKTVEGFAECFYLKGLLFQVIA